jgi:alpha-glucosidase
VGGEYNYLAYARFNRNGQCLVLINNNDYILERKLSVWEIGTPKEGELYTLIQTTEDGYSLEEQVFPLKSGKILIQLPEHSATILKYRR